MKMCSRCKNELPYDAFGADRSRTDGLRRACKPCERSNRDKAKQKAYYQANKEARNAYGIEYYKQHKGTAKKNAKKSLKKAVDGLSDTYIKQILVKYTTLKRCEIPQELVELKRLEIAIKRKVRDMTDEKC